MLKNDDIIAYNKNLKTEKKYRRDYQILQKERVFSTFNTLLRFTNNAPLVKGKKLLDLGSADNAFINVCKSKKINAKGLDITDGINFEKDNFPFKNNSFDLVTAISVIEHLYSPSKFILEIKRVLKPRCPVIMVLPNWRYSTKSFYNNPTHVHPYTEQSIFSLLSSFNFDEILVVPWLVNKSKFWWNIPYSFFVAKWLIPFKGSAPKWVPSFLKGSSSSILVLGLNSHEK